MATPKKMGKALSPKKTASLVLGVEQVQQASKISTALRDVIEQQELFTVIQGKKFITVEGWNTLGAMIGVFPEVVRTEQLPGKKTQVGNIEIEEIKYLAEVQLKTVQGQIISMAQAICSNNEAKKRGQEEYAIFSMAQTRATGKAFRLAFSWLVKMAGYEATPSEETDGINKRPMAGSTRTQAPDLPRPKL